MEIRNFEKIYIKMYIEQPKFIVLFVDMTRVYSLFIYRVLITGENILSTSLSELITTFMFNFFISSAKN